MLMSLRSWIFVLLLLLSVAVDLTSTSKATGECSVTTLEYESLHELYNSTNGDAWSYPLPYNNYNGYPWNFTTYDLTSPCSKSHPWQGLNCSSQCDILRMILFNLNMVGTLPNSIGNFPKLQVFILENSYFLKGTLPDSITKLTNLNTLQFSLSSMTGSIPDNIGQLTKLTTLEINSMGQTGSIPSSLWNLTQLTYLSLSANQLTGRLPKDMARLSRLVTLDLIDNLFSGTVPSFFIEMKSLQNIYLSSNRFTHTLPNIPWNTMKNLTSLELSSNKLVGTIPPSIWLCSSLQFFSISSNKFNGSLPQSYPFFTSISEFEINNNEFTGTIPDGLGQLTTLQILDLAANKLYGTIPTSFINLSLLESLYLNSNALRGEVPEGIYSLQTLQSFNLNNNFFNGTIPSSICTNSYLSYFNIENNSFSGSIPSCMFYDCSQLMAFIVAGNYLEGGLPHRTNQSWTTTYLNTITATNNSFDGSIPADVFTLEFLTTIHLDNNKFSGSIPPIVAPMYNSLTLLSLANNRLTGTIPDKLVHFMDIQTLDLNDNFFDGSLYSVVSQWIYLITIDCSRNLFTGRFPAFSTFIILNNVYLYNNYFTGNILFSGSQQTTVLNMILDHNHFTGNLSRVEVLTHMVQCSIMNNFVSGTLPTFNSRLLKYVYVGDNLMTGSIGKSLLSLPFLSALQLQNNALTGSLDNAFSLQVQNKTSVIDLSNNFFTGSIPLMFFQFPQLSYFAAVTNCLSASIPSAICNLNQTLNTLALDGMHTASRCQHRIFPTAASSSSEIETYTLPSQVIEGSLPSCLFTAMTNLTTLHLSGNGIKGKLPDNFDFIVASLKELSLSHNLFTGTIPLAFQTHNWDILDLSFNRFTGVLESTFSSSFDQANTTLKLNLNRLSGSIPSSLLHVQDIQILTGNMFSCNQQRSDLPSQDHDSTSYGCGSDAVNTSMMVYGSGLALIITMMWLYMRWIRRMSFLSLLYSITLHYSSPEEVQSYPNILKFNTFLHNLRVWMLFMTLFMTMLLFIYLALSAYYSTYTYAYAWQISVAYLSGIAPALILFFCYVILFALMFISDRNVFAIRNLKVTSTVATTENRISNASHEDNYRARTRSQFASLDMDSYSKDGEGKNGEGKQNFCSKFHCDVFTTRLILECMINIIIVVVINAVYIYFYISQISIEQRTVLTISMSVFKESWRQFLTLQMKWKIDYLSQLQAPVASAATWIKDSTTSPTTKQSTTNWKPYTIFMLFTFLCLFNNIISPLLATTFINPNCFYYAIIAQDPITSTSTVPFCFSTTNNTYVPCANTAELTLSTTYDPAFSYNFLCSSSLLSTFANVWMYLFLYNGLLFPIIKLALIKFIQSQDRVKRSSDLLDRIKQFLPLTYLDKTTLLSVLEKEENISDLIVFSPRKFVLILVTNIAVFLCFGMIFPPIAIVGCISVLVQCYLEQYLLQRLISFTIRDGNEDAEKNDDYGIGIKSLVKLADRQCQGVDHSVVKNLRELKWLIAIFWSLFLMDIIGDQIGWKGAIWIIIFFLAFCIFIRLRDHFKLTIVQLLPRSTVKGNSPRSSEMSAIRSSSTLFQNSHELHSKQSSIVSNNSLEKVDWVDIRSSEIDDVVTNPIANHQS